MQPENYLMPKFRPKWAEEWEFKHKNGTDNCASNAISFRVNPAVMRQMNAILYGLCGASETSI